MSEEIVGGLSSVSLGENVADSSGPEIYTSETRGSDEAGEGTYKVPYKTILKVHFLLFHLN
jgi:hypothetical protein